MWEAGGRKRAQHCQSGWQSTLFEILLLLLLFRDSNDFVLFHDVVRTDLWHSPARQPVNQRCLTLQTMQSHSGKKGTLAIYASSLCREEMDTFEKTMPTVTLRKNWTYLQTAQSLSRRTGHTGANKKYSLHACRLYKQSYFAGGKSGHTCQLCTVYLRKTNRTHLQK